MTTNALHQYAYGDHPDQFVRLTIPCGDSGNESGKNSDNHPDPWPVVVVLHGGFWRPAYGIELADPLAADLAQHRVAALAVEYRRAGRGGGWPETLLDVAAAVDSLAGQGQSVTGGRLDLERVAVVGHSAGGHLAAWLVHRASLPDQAPGGNPVVGLLGAVSQGGVLDLVEAARLNLGNGATQNMMGGRPDDRAAEYRLASPIEWVGDGARVVCVHGVDDDVVPISQSERYRNAAVDAGDPVSLIPLPAVGHMELVDPEHWAWASCREQVLRLVIGPDQPATRTPR